MPSDYEIYRESKIARNNARLSSLGLLDVTTSRTTKNKRKRTAQSTTTARKSPTRRSARTKTTQASGTVEASFAHAPSLPAHLSSHLSTVLPDPRPKTRFSQYHQHLQVSKDRHTVATTGCAGYGVCTISGSSVGKSSGKSSGMSTRTSSGSFTITPLVFGTGGFAVGLVAAAWRGPYKSLRKNPATAVAWYDTGQGGSGFDGYHEGDVLVLAWEKKTVRLEINGTVATTFAIEEGDYVGAVQPFMGGVARLLA